MAKIFYERKAPNVTTVMGVHFLPGTHSADIPDTKWEKIQKDDAFKFELEKERIIIRKNIDAKTAAQNGVISLVELEEIHADAKKATSTQRGKITKARKAEEAADVIAELEKELDSLLKAENDAAEAIEIRKKELEEAEGDAE